jgi:ribosomal protein S18 acetylase RimI-like enzyme
MGVAYPSPACTVRTAVRRDIPAVHAVDAACFPPGDPDREPAAPGEIEKAVDEQEVRIAEAGGRVVGYLLADRSMQPGRIHVSGVAVLPECQRRGLGSGLLDDFLHRADVATLVRVPIILTTSPRNLVMLRLACSRGFLGRRLLRDFYGPGKDRLSCQLGLENTRRAVAASIPVHDLAGLSAALETGELVLRGVSAASARGPEYELAPIGPGDFPSARTRCDGE